MPTVDYSQLSDAFSAVVEHEKNADYATDITSAHMELAKQNEDIRNSGSYNRKEGAWYVGTEKIEGTLLEYQTGKTNEVLGKLKTKYAGDQKAEQDILSLGLTYGKNAVQNTSSARTSGDIDYIEGYRTTLLQGLENGHTSMEEVSAGLKLATDSIYATPEQKSALHQNNNDLTGSADYFTNFNKNPSATYEQLKYGDRYNFTSEAARGRMDTHARNWAASEARNAISTSMNSSAVLFRYQIDPQIIRLAKETGNLELASAAVAANERNAKIQAFTNGDLKASMMTLEIGANNAFMKNDASALQEVQDMQRAVASVAQTAKTNPEVIAIQHGLTEQPTPLEMSAQGVEAFWSSFGRLREEIKARYNIEADAISDTGAATIVNAIKSNNVDKRVDALYALTSPVSDNDIGGVSRKLAAVSPNVGVAMSLREIGDKDLATAILSGDDFKKSYGLPQDHDMKSMFKKHIGNQLSEADPAMQEAMYASYSSAYAYYASKQQVSNSTVSEDISKDIASRMTGTKYGRFGTSSFGIGEKKTINFAINGQWADQDLATDAMETALSTNYFEGVYGQDGIPANSKEILKNGSLIPTGNNGVYAIKRNDGSYYADINGNPYMFDAKSAYTIHASKMPLGKFKQSDGRVSSR
jgi:hypothetical protein